MSKKYSTEQLIEYLLQLVTVLRAADKLCEVAKIVSLEIASFDDVIVCEPGDLEKLRKAIAEYEGKE